MSHSPRIEVVWFDNDVLQEVRRGVDGRLKKAAEHVQTRITHNLSQPVYKVRKKRRRKTSRGPKGSSYTYTLPESRSKRGAYPKAETSHLRRSIFKEFHIKNNETVAHVGTTVHYGVILELALNRSFLIRTFYEEFFAIRHLILTSRSESPAFQLRVWNTKK